MKLTLNGLTALRILRAIRTHEVTGRLSRRCDFKSPDSGDETRWSKKSVSKHLSFLGAAGSFSEQHPLDVLVSSRDQRLRIKGAKNTCRLDSYPPGSFIDLGHGVAICGPELVFVEMANVMDSSVHLLLGMELCGRFSRSSVNPRNGKVVYDIEPATTVEQLRAFATLAHWIRGAEKALATIDRIVENAWSPMEAIVAALLVLPRYELGYDLWPITLNPKKELGEQLSRFSDKESRVPDIMFKGTDVGLNYDGEDHFKLADIARAAIAADRDPGNRQLAQELDETIAEARNRIIEDKRRDRDLLSLGLTVFSITKEDLEEPGGFDRVVGQLIAAIEASGQRVLVLQRSMIEKGSLADARQDFIWSMMPGRHAEEARDRLEERKRSMVSKSAYRIEFELQDGTLRIISIDEL